MEAVILGDSKFVVTESNTHHFNTCTDNINDANVRKIFNEIVFSWERGRWK